MMKRKIALIAGLLFALPVFVAAAPMGIVGDCVDCHTMHNSEQGTTNMLRGLTTTPGDPLPNLLRMDCIACHAMPTASTPTVTLPGGSIVPQVSQSSDDNLAGGNFRYIAEGGNRKGHNVIDLVPADTENLFPPGHRHASSAIGEGGFDVDNFTCAGSMGCHGYRGQVLDSTELACDPFTNEKYINGDPTGEQCTAQDLANVGTSYNFRTGLEALSGYDGFPSTSLKRGAHHQSFDGLKNNGFDPDYYDSPLAHSYRFLLALRGYGNEVDRWKNVDENSHNEYAGGYLNNPLGDLIKATDFGTTSTCGRCHFGGSIGDTNSRIYTSGGTMTGFCITCHGKFHSSGVTNGTSGAFLRHPSDWVIPDRGEYSAYTTYDVTAPVARPLSVFVDGMSGSSAVTAGEDLVMCLSCHVAHASPYDYMLRFDYSAMTAGGYADIATATGDISTDQGVGAGAGCLACHTAKGVLPENR